MKLDNNLIYKISAIPMLAILVAALLPILQINWVGSRYLMAAGAICVFVLRLMTKFHGDNIRLKRLHRMETVASICYLLSAFFMFYPQAQQSDWLGFLMGGAVLQVYASFMSSYIEEKARKQKKTKK